MATISFQNPTISFQNLNPNARQKLRNTFITLHEFYKYMQIKKVDGNEALTREQLIRPFIKALDYIVDSQSKNGTILLDLWPEITGREDNDNRCDFLIKLNPQIDHVHAVVEAKPVNRDLDKAIKGDTKGTPTNQLRKYFEAKDWKATVILGILTNGYEYRFFKNRETVNPNDSGMEPEPFFKTTLRDLSENKDHCIDKLYYYVCKKVVEACSRIITKTDNDSLLESAQKSFGEHVKKINQIIEVRSIILDKVKTGMSINYLQQLINNINSEDENTKTIKRQEMSVLIWSKVSDLKLSYESLQKNASKQRKDSAEKEYLEWISIVKTILDELEEPGEDLNPPTNGPENNDGDKDNNKNGETTHLPEPGISSSLTPIITTQHELDVRDCIQTIVGDLCEVKHIDNIDYIDFVISRLSPEKLKEKEQKVLQKAKDSKDCVFCMRYGKQNTDLNDHPQEGNYNNAALTFFKTRERTEPSIIELRTRIENAGKDIRTGCNGWISVEIKSMNDINALKDAIQHWFSICKKEFDKN